MDCHYEMLLQPQREGNKTNRGARNPSMDEKSYSLLEALRIDRYYVSTSDEELTSDPDDKNEEEVSIKSKRKLKRKSGRRSPKNNISEDDDDDDAFDDPDMLSKKQRKKQQKKAGLVNAAEEGKENVKERRERRQMERQIKESHKIYDFSKIEDTDLHTWGHFCGLCSAEFTTKNRLFEHVKRTGHAAYMPRKSDNKNKKNNGQRTSKTKANFYRRN